ncbi:MAG: hypothetical protein C0623_12500 [Desulfuromonas sp.]|nr:MAG: hypothetical protein C0623_12500 [Desulfuromonas sp.]
MKMNRLFVPVLILVAITLVSCSDSGSSGVTDNTGLKKVQGQILAPLEGTYLYIYEKGMDLYGPAFAVSPATGPDGHFDLSLPPGEYVVVARKRQEGQANGPVVSGDNRSEFINLKVEDNLSSLTIVAPVKVGDSRRLSEQLEAGKTGISGTIFDSDGNPLEGTRVHVYDHVQMSERPKYVSEKTTPDGKYLIYLPKGGTYYLAARDKFGGPPKLGDLYGRYDQGTIEPSAVIVKEGEILQDVNITVTKVW